MQVVEQKQPAAASPGPVLGTSMTEQHLVPSGEVTAPLPARAVGHLATENQEKP